MVYRLVPSHRFQAQSHFGTEDMTKPKMLKGLVLGLVVAAIVLGFLAYLILKKQVNLPNGKMNLKMNIPLRQKNMELNHLFLEIKGHFIQIDCLIF